MYGTFKTAPRRPAGENSRGNSASRQRQRWRLSSARTPFPGISHDPFVDNVRFGIENNNPTYLANAAQSFRAACTQANITLNVEPLNAPHQQGMFTGIDYDYATGTASNTDKTRLKLSHARTALLSKTATLNDVFEAYGILSLKRKKCKEFITNEKYKGNDIYFSSTKQIGSPDWFCL